MRKSYKKAQSILEYIIVLTAVVAIILYASIKYIKPAVNTTLSDADTLIGKAAGYLPK